MLRTEDHPVVVNRILRALPQATIARLWPELDTVELVRGQSIGHVDQRVKHMYFVNRGIVSLVKSMRDGRMVEIGAIGIEGVSDPQAVFGLDQTMLESIVQVPGMALRIKACTLKSIMQDDSALRGLMERYSRFSFHQLAQTAACNRLHNLEQRCCRWLLIAHDSALSDTFALTHEFLAMMLGVQRAGVTVVANALKQAGLIRYTHGVVTVVNRRGLEADSCECYRCIEAESRALFSLQPNSPHVLSS